MNREDRGFLVWVFLLGVVVIALIFLASALNLITLPWQYDTRRNAEMHSTAYVQGKVGQLNNLMSDYGKLQTKIAENSDNADVVSAYKAQEKSDVTLMWDTYDAIPQDIRPSAVPSDIQQFLSTHGR